jgi:hypothetical protein
MNNVAKELEKNGNEWAVAVTKSYFVHDDRVQLAALWDLVSITSASELDPYFARCLAQIATVLYPEERLNVGNILFLEARPNILAAADQMYAALVMEKTVLGLFMLDDKFETDVRLHAISAKRVETMLNDVTNIAKSARQHANYAKKHYGHVSKVDASSCEHMMQTIKNEITDTTAYIKSIAARVQVF